MSDPRLTPIYGDLSRPWHPSELDTFVSCPHPLRPILQTYHDEERRTIASRLARELRLIINPPEEPALRVCWTLTAPLAEAIAEGYVLMDDRPSRIVREAVSDLHVGTLHGAILGFGWGNTSLPRTSVGHLARVFADLLADKLTPEVTKMMRRWEKRGYLTTEGQR